ncbi:MAG: NADP-dependent oxidoreductase [Pseudomonadales bacterium]|jgi:NADPH-dependent curcumin reductase CurA|nr:NADP-dependent oxidoreductase [Pseudomonadales bacterium]
MPRNRRVLLRELPSDKLAPEHFAMDEVDAPDPGAGQVLVRTILLSQDAANRAWMQGATYRDAITAGQVMDSGGIGEVVASRAEGIAVGDLVWGETGWQEYAVLEGRRVSKVGPHRPLSHQISLLGVAGKTAYHGLLNVPGIHAGETLLVSAAAGSVGSMVGQIGRIRGARVVGIAGGAEKCAWVKETLGFDACLDYKDLQTPLPKQVRAACPDGVDVYFDNTGGDILQAALFAMNNRGRISCCGAVSMYDGKPRPGPFGVPGLIVVKRLRVEGFIVSDFAHLDADAEHDLALWAQDGHLKVVEDILDGLERAPEGLIGLLAGDNRGKRMIRVAPDPS